MNNWVDDILRKVANKDAAGFEKIKELNDVCKKVAVDRMETLVKQDIPPAVAFIIAINALLFASLRSFSRSTKPFRGLRALQNFPKIFPEMC